MKFKNTKKIIFFLILVFVIAGAIYGYKEYNRKAEDIANLKPNFNTNINTIINEFSTNDSTANVKYVGKTIEVSGSIDKIEKDDNGYFTVVMGNPASNTSLRFSMDSIHNNEAKKIKNNDSISMKGICTGYNNDELGLGADIIFNHSCITNPIIKNN